MNSINIERSVLSSIFFDQEIFEDILGLLKVEDFYHPAHRKIYGAMEILHKESLPIDEEFVRRKIKDKDVTDDIMIEILSTNPITNPVVYGKELKKDSLKREIELCATKLKSEFDINQIHKLEELKMQFTELDGLKKLKNLDHKTANLFDKFDINYDQVENVKFEYLIDNFVIKNEITMFSSRPGIGKSLVSVALANMLLNNNAVNEVLYLDADNSISTIKERNIHHLKKQHGAKFRYFVNLSKSDMMKIVKTLQQLDLANKLVIIDSVKHLIFGDRDKNKDVSIAMEILKSLRKNGATVIFLHHQNKASGNDFEADFAGSSAFAEDTTNAFTLKRNDDKNAFIFKPFKARAGELHELAFGYSSHNHTLTQLDLNYAKQTKLEEEMANETVEFIENSRKEPTWSELYNNLLELGFEKNKASKIIKDNENKLWIARRGERNNQKLYSLLDSKPTKSNEPVQIIFENSTEKEKLASITPITSGSLFYGLSELSNSQRITSGTRISGSNYYPNCDTYEYINKNENEFLGDIA